jgi:hypothetical protein
MFKGLIRRFITNDDVSHGEYLKLKLELEYTKLQLSEIKQQLLFQQASHKDIPVSGFDDLEVEPITGKKRQKYIADVTTFFDNILHRKIKSSIAEIRGLLSNIGRQEGTPLSMSRVEYDMFLRGMEASLWKMHDWAINLDAERKQDLIDKENNNG